MGLGHRHGLGFKVGWAEENLGLIGGPGHIDYGPLFTGLTLIGLNTNNIFFFFTKAQH